MLHELCAFFMAVLAVIESNCLLCIMHVLDKLSIQGIIVLFLCYCAA